MQGGRNETNNSAVYACGWISDASSVHLGRGLSDAHLRKELGGVSGVDDDSHIFGDSSSVGGDWRRVLI